MPFEPVNRHRQMGRPPFVKHLTASLLKLDAASPCIEIRLSLDLAQALGVAGGGRVMVMQGVGEDAGSFALERAEHDCRAYKVNQRETGGMHFLRVSARLLTLGNLEHTKHFTPEVQGGRVIGRAHARGFFAIAAE